MLNSTIPFKEQSHAPSQARGSRISPIMNSRLFFKDLGNAILTGGLPGCRVTVFRSATAVCWGGLPARFFALEGNSLAPLASQDSHWTATFAQECNSLLPFQS